MSTSINKNKDSLTFIAQNSVLNQYDFEIAMEKINELIKIPDIEMTNEQAKELNALASAVQKYEKLIHNIVPPTTIDGILEVKIYELQLSHAGMAKKLKVSNSKLSLIRSGKQKPDIHFIKNMHDNLNIDGNYLLSVI